MGDIAQPQRSYNGLARRSGRLEKCGKTGRNSASFGRSSRYPSPDLFGLFEMMLMIVVVVLFDKSCARFVILTTFMPFPTVTKDS